MLQVKAQFPLKVIIQMQAELPGGRWAWAGSVLIPQTPMPVALPSQPQACCSLTCRGRGRGEAWLPHPPPHACPEQKISESRGMRLPCVSMPPCPMQVSKGTAQPPDLVSLQLGPPATLLPLFLRAEVPGSLAVSGLTVLLPCARVGCYPRPCSEALSPAQGKRRAPALENNNSTHNADD